MDKPEQFKIRPYARLLTMLGDQLIKNERIALMELIKNSYDADAEWVKVSFLNFGISAQLSKGRDLTAFMINYPNKYTYDPTTGKLSVKKAMELVEKNVLETIFTSIADLAEIARVMQESRYGENYKIQEDSKIIIEDSGHGMTLDIIKNHWLNPATPEKKIRKSKKSTTEKGRILQGDKGIGRFAILKLGRVITIVTRAKGEEAEHVIKYDFSKYDDDFLTHNEKEEVLFLDDLSVSISPPLPPQTIVAGPLLLGSQKLDRVPYGTRIEIANLKGSWTESKVSDVYRDISRLQPIFDILNTNQEDFQIYIYKDEEVQNFQEEYLEKLQILLADRAVIKIEDGCFDSAKNVFSFVMNSNPTVISLNDPLIKGDTFFAKRFGEAGKVFDERGTACGPFKFGFYIFDFSAQAPAKFKLDKEDKEILKEHRIYLYRDDIRVYPYGDPEDDWLRIDALRGTISAGAFLSNDQVVGYVNISQKDNPDLKDKTNREGLIEQGNATEDFITLIQTLLSYIRKKPYAQYRLGLGSKKAHDIFRTGQIQKDFDELKTTITENKRAQAILARTEKEYKAERQFLVQRAETTEELAGVGISVETASHDIMGIMEKVFANLDGLLKDLMTSDNIDKDELLKELQSIRGGMSFIEAQLKDIQLLFKSSKQRRRSIRIKDIIDKIERIYHRHLKKQNITLDIRTVGSPLIAKTTDAVLLQLLLNLMDNAIYWLMQVSTKDKKIEIVLDGNKCQMIFADNGPGVSKEDAPYIFEPFYSGKGEGGRGLGLYIARQLLERNDYSIDLADVKANKVLSGANFVVNFVSKEEWI